MPLSNPLSLNTSVHLETALSALESSLNFIFLMHQENMRAADGDPEQGLMVTCRLTSSLFVADEEGSPIKAMDFLARTMFHPNGQIWLSIDQTGDEPNWELIHDRFDAEDHLTNEFSIRVWVEVKERLKDCMDKLKAGSAVPAGAEFESFMSTRITEVSRQNLTVQRDHLKEFSSRHTIVDCTTLSKVGVPPTSAFQFR